MCITHGYILHFLNELPCYLLLNRWSSYSSPLTGGLGSKTNHRLVPDNLDVYLLNLLAASWRKCLDARLPPLGSRVRVSDPPCGFRGGRNRVWVGFSWVSPVFPYHKFHSTISPHSSHPFRFISSALVMVRQVWSAGTLATHRPII